MLAGPTAPPAQEPEHPLTYLPSSRIFEFAIGDLIYDSAHPSTALYLIIDGTVKVQRIIGEQVALVVDIYGTHEMFGESTFTGSSEAHEMATAMVKTRVMTWTRHEVEELILRQPHVAIALIHFLTKRSAALARRIVSLAADGSEHRLARTLLYFSERFGRAMDDGSTQMMPLSHELLAQYLGTTRENVTQFMIQFRSRGYVRYSRKEIVLYPEAIRQWLTGNVASAGSASSL